MRDPVCGMTVKTPAAHVAGHDGETFAFCSAHCREKFLAEPEKYAPHDHGHHQHAAAADSEAIYTCPMHPQIRHKGPGACPICGMALEPLKVTR
ncbi:MAG TPA: YHS domain-containing protein, partial [Rhizomicrobium sp.]